MFHAEAFRNELPNNISIDSFWADLDRVSDRFPTGVLNARKGHFAIIGAGRAVAAFFPAGPDNVFGRVLVFVATGREEVVTRAPNVL